MTTLSWDATTASRYEAGVDRGVLYPSSGPGVPWNGLLSVDESSVGGERTVYVEDGVSFLQTVGGRDYDATVTAFSAPKEFAACVGDLEIRPGVFLTRQNKSSFGFAYRTMIGASDYKIHLIYNAVATPSSRAYATTNDTPVPVNLQWDISCVPFISGTYRPSAHFIVDSTKVGSTNLSALETLLYGTSTADPAMPSPSDIYTLFGGV